MRKDTTRLSKEILNWYYIGDEIPAKDWSDKVAELEAERDAAYNRGLERGVERAANIK